MGREFHPTTLPPYHPTTPPPHTPNAQCPMPTKNVKSHNQMAWDWLK
ncbi:MAG: hypothetical protein RMY29_011140 [Nostoc sp. CreGUA01]